MLDTLQYVKKHGQCLDHDLAKDRGIPLALAHQELRRLAETQQIVMCKVTRFDKGNPVESWVCRISGYSPPATPGRKASAPEVRAAT